MEITFGESHFLTCVESLVKRKCRFNGYGVDKGRIALGFEVSEKFARLGVCRISGLT